MKLLLDSMFSPVIAQQLRRRRHDVIAARERFDLENLSDWDLFAAAQREARSVVTENGPDFLPIDAAYRQHDRAHHELILTTDHRFSRRTAGHIGQLVTSLDALLRSKPTEQDGDNFVHWLR